MERIERYLLKEMPEEEYNAFEKRISSDAPLRQKVESVKLMLVGIQESILSEKIDNFHKEVTMAEAGTGQPRSKLFSMKRWMVAASVVVLLGFSAVLFFTKSGGQERLFSEYYKPDPGLSTAMGESDKYLFDHAMIDYKTGKYDSAIKTWQQLYQSNPQSDTLNYFLGSAFMAKEKVKEAIPYFERALAKDDTHFADDANWYLALAFTKEKKYDEAVSYLKKTNHKGKNSFLAKLKKLQ